MISSKEIRAVFKLTQEQLSHHLRDFYKANGRKVYFKSNQYLFIEGTSNACVVAHLDTVHSRPPVNILAEKHPDKTIYSSKFGIGADDRCGVLAAIKLNELNDDSLNLLFTFNEEIGGLGVKTFVKGKLFNRVKEHINVFLEFDRKGSNDYVLYGYQNEEVQNILEAVGFVEALGSYSDVKTLSDKGILGINLSTGYYNQHRKNEYFVLEELENNIKRVNSILQELAIKKRVAMLVATLFDDQVADMYSYGTDAEMIEAICTFYDNAQMNGLSGKSAIEFVTQCYEEWEFSLRDEPSVIVRALLDEMYGEVKKDVRIRI